MRHGVRRSRTFGTKAAAEAWAEHGTNTRHSLSAALRRYSDEVSPTKRGERWETLRLAYFERIIPFAGKAIDRVTPDDMGRWRDSRLREVSAGSVIRELTLLSAVFTCARKQWRWVTGNPCHEIVWPRKAAARTRRVSEAEIAAILAQLGWQNAPPQTSSQQVALAFLLALETAMRAGEIIGLTPDRVFPDLRYLHLDKTKNGTARDVPLSSEALRLLALIPGGFTITTATLDTLFRRATRAAGIKGLHFHDTRRTSITRLSKKLQPYELAAMTGHKDLRTLMRVYYSPEPSVAAGKLG